MLRQENQAFFYARVNVGFQTTLQVYTYDNQLYFGWFITRQLAHSAIKHINQPIRRLLTQSTDYVLREKPFLHINSAGLKQGGDDQIYIEVAGVQGAMILLENPDMVLSFRKFNLGLVQKGPCPWGRFHCLDMADRLVE